MSASHSRATALLLSVGGSAAPALHALGVHQPSHVAYFCSAGTRSTAEGIHRQYVAVTLSGPTPVADYLESPSHEELGPCYAVLRRWLPQWLSERGLSPDAVTVDYTGGTKTLSAALVLAASEGLQHFSYVGGSRRDAGGTGVVVQGSERIHLQSNPWRELAVRELEQARILWDLQQYRAAATLLQRTRRQVPDDSRHAFGRISDLALALDDRLALQLSAAADRLSRLARKLANHPPPPESPAVAAHARLQCFCERAAVRLSAAEALNGPAADPSAQLRELLDNALLTARLGRRDDAAARLYRALELFGQNELARMTTGAFVLGRLQAASSLPSAAAGFPAFTGTDGEATARRGIALEQVYRLLAYLHHPAGLRAVAEFDGAGSATSPWRQATLQRNQSILAHGLQPVSESGFRSLATLVGSYVSQSTDHVDLEAPCFDLAWFDW